MKICFLPIDNRPVCYSLAKDICAIDEGIELFLPERKFLGDLTKTADIENLLEWLNNVPQTDAIILSLDTLVYGGLIPSRRSTETFDELKTRLDRIKQILATKKSKIYAFSSIMRISNNNYNEEEKEYWSEYGKKFFEYSYKTHKDEEFETDIPQEILDDYLKTRKRNFEINKIYLEWQKEGLLDTLIFSKDDCAEYGFNVQEAQELEKLGGKTKTGADEIPLTLLARAVDKKIKVFVEFTEPEYKDKISNYEDISIEKSVMGQLELGGFEITEKEEAADLVLLVNNFIDKQGELVMGWNTKSFNKGLILPDKPYAIADVRWANGADNTFVEQLLNKLIDTLPHSGTSPADGEDCLSPLRGKCHEVTKGDNDQDICPPCGENVPTGQKGVHHQYYAPYIKAFVRELRQNMTLQEVKIWQQIRRNRLGVKFRRQYQINNKYIADFVCLEKQLIIEIDGGQHCESFSDIQRTFYLEQLGFRIVRFWNNEVDKNLEGCINFLKRVIDTPLPPSGTSPTSGGDCLSTLRGKCHEVTKGVYKFNFYGYAGWNTSANTLGTIIATIKTKWNAEKYNKNAFKKLQTIRFLDDWAYQANIRGQITKPSDIKELMQPYEKQLETVFDYKIQAEYSYPWNRKFEVEVSLC